MKTTRNSISAPLSERLGAVVKFYAQEKVAQVLAGAMRFVGWGGQGGGFGGGFLGRFGSRDAGALWKNSAAYACIRWATKTFPEAPPQILAVATDGTKKPDLSHPIIRLLRRPNPHYDGAILWSGILLSLIVDGNAYLIKIRSAAGKVVQLWYVPHFQMAPRWPVDGSTFISHYAYLANGIEIPIPVSDVIHFRDGMDPENTRKGLSSLGAVLREIVADNEATSYTESILANMGVPGVIIMPEAGAEIDKQGSDKVKMLWDDRVSGENRGAPLVVPIPLKFETPGFSPEQLALDKIRHIPESRICAAIGIPAMVAQLSVGGLQKTYANYGEARQAAYEEFIVPTQRLLSGPIEMQLLPEFEPNERRLDALEFGFDLSHVRVLQEDQDALFKRISDAYRAGWIKRAEAKAAANMPFDESEDDIYLTDISGGMGAGSASVETDGLVAGDGVGDPQKPRAAKKDAAAAAAGLRALKATFAQQSRRRREQFEADGVLDGDLAADDDDTDGDA